MPRNVCCAASETLTVLPCNEMILTEAVYVTSLFGIILVQMSCSTLAKKRRKNRRSLNSFFVSSSFIMRTFLFCFVLFCSALLCIFPKQFRYFGLRFRGWLVSILHKSYGLCWFCCTNFYSEFQHIFLFFQ